MNKNGLLFWIWAIEVLASIAMVVAVFRAFCK
jgi:hypothetical protein